LIGVRPFDTKLRNNLEIVNESFILINIEIMYLFTDFIPDPNLRDKIGWLIIALTCLNFGLNMIIFIMLSITKLVTVVKSSL
jgi:hypothetical protein